MFTLILFVVFNLGFNQDSILMRAGNNESEIKNFIIAAEQKNYQSWAQFLMLTWSI